MSFSDRTDHEQENSAAHPGILVSKGGKDAIAGERQSIAPSSRITTDPVTGLKAISVERVITMEHVRRAIEDE